MGYRIHRRMRIPLLTVHHGTQRLPWTREHLCWTLGMRKNVAWTEELRFTLVHADGRVRVQRKTYETVYVLPTGYSSNWWRRNSRLGTVYVGWNGTHTTGGIVCHRSTLPGYAEWLCPPVCLSSTSHWRLYLEQDHATGYRSQIVYEWLDGYPSNSNLLP